MPRHFYLYFGLRVTSSIPIPEWELFECDDLAEEPDAFISVTQSVDETLDVSGEPGGAAAARRFSVPGIGEFLVRAGRDIIVAPAQGVEPHRLRPWLIGSAWSSLCYQRGIYLIHASAVLVEDEAVLFCAAAKGGKSTLAAYLNDRGHALLSDDICRLEVPDHGAPLVYPSAPRFKLWSDALQALGWETQALEPDAFRKGKFHVKPESRSVLQTSPVRGIYLLEWGDFGIYRLSGLTALRRFLQAATYRPAILASSGRLNHHSGRSLALLNQVPVWELRRPRDLKTIGRAGDMLKRQWAGDRIMAK
jgi:hypothetical protein